MPEKKYDAIVVGSGATGGFAAKELAERGLEVLVLEAGPYLREKWFHAPAHMKSVGSMSRVMAGLKGQHNQARGSWFSPENAFLFVNDRKNPYTFPRGAYYLWLRGRNVGGRFLSWGRVAVRMSDYDFKAASRDGFGEDWPICYEDLIRYYEQVEEFLGIIGTSDGIPNLPDGKYVKTAGLSSLERQLKEKVESTWPGRKVVPWRYAVAEATPTDESGENRTSGRRCLPPREPGAWISSPTPSPGSSTSIRTPARPLVSRMSMRATKQSHQVSAECGRYLRIDDRNDPSASQLRMREASKRGRELLGHPRPLLHRSVPLPCLWHRPGQ